MADTKQPPPEEDLYLMLELQKGCPEADIKKSYRKLALRYHPDKNPDDPDATTKFQQINRAYTVLNDPKKRQIYDEYGSFGLYICDQFGEDTIRMYQHLSSTWCKVLGSLCCISTCFCCCFCCCCCCNFCCGKCKPKNAEDVATSQDGVVPNDEPEENAGAETAIQEDGVPPRCNENWASTGNPSEPVTVQPKPNLKSDSPSENDAMIND